MDLVSHQAGDKRVVRGHFVVSRENSRHSSNITDRAENVFVLQISFVLAWSGEIEPKSALGLRDKCIFLGVEHSLCS